MVTTPAEDEVWVQFEPKRLAAAGLGAVRSEFVGGANVR